MEEVVNHKLTKDSEDTNQTMENMKLCLTKEMEEAGINPRQKPLMPIKNVSKIHTMEERKGVQSKSDF